IVAQLSRSGARGNELFYPERPYAGVPSFNPQPLLVPDVRVLLRRLRIGHQETGSLPPTRRRGAILLPARCLGFMLLFMQTCFRRCDKPVRASAAVAIKY